ncbi:LIV-I protein H [Thalassovita autumnalis]|uniref:LIV-I protein H n=1 Tax=Thalassovita autumnalis TaxID=2072972 RepID=A0A0N7LUY1_9RHOB|nr:branched-chain amino acid ABC transporter permease [Thalassovita autumnalis]CUH64762.1 LIV-I protein H [Thalassovita autumnalis]CUH72647.1 LIV-I protein H [Thalassovita autumnalis]
MLLTTLMIGLVLGGTYALVALGLSMQYGIARIMNLAHGEFMIAAAFCAYVLFNGAGLPPLVTLLIALPLGYGLSWLVYSVMMHPLVKRAPNRGQLEADSILATFGLLFILQGIMLLVFGSDFTSYSYLNHPINLWGTNIAANRLVAFIVSLTLGLGLYVLITRTRWGATLRAVALSPASAPLVGIQVDKVARQAFAIGGSLAAGGGVLVSMFVTFSAAGGVVFTMKALIVVIMGGTGNLMGAIIAGLALGIIETFVTSYIDPGLSLASVYILFIIVLLWRPQGLFGTARS